MRTFLSQLIPSRKRVRHLSKITQRRVSGLGLLCLEARDVPAGDTFTWLGSETNPGAAANWSDTTVWSLNGNRTTNQRPGDGDTVIFNGTNKSDSIDDIPNLSLASLQIMGQINANTPGYTGKITLSQTLTVAGGSMSTLTDTANDYTLTGDKDLVIASSGSFRWISGTMAGSGKTIVSAGATLTIESTSAPKNDARLAGRTLYVAAAGSGSPGTVNLTSGQLYCQNDPTGNNQAASITNAGRFVIKGTASGIIGSSQVTFTTAAGGQTELDLNNINSPFTISTAFDNQSKAGFGVYLRNGTMSLTGGGKSTGTWGFATGERLEFGTVGAAGPLPSFEWGTGTEFTGKYARIVVNADVSTTAASVSVEPALMLTGGSLKSGSAASIVDIKTSLYWIGGKTAKQNDSSTPGTIRIDSNAQAIIYGDTTVAQAVPALTDGWTVENSGLMNLGVGQNAAATHTRVDFQMGGDATIKNVGTGSFIIRDTSGITLAAGASALGKIRGAAGSFTKNANTGTSDIRVKMEGIGGAAFTVQGGSTLRQLDIQGNEINKIEPDASPKKVSFEGPYDFDTTTTVGAGGKLVGDGTITTVTFSNAGTVNPGDTNAAGSLTFNGSYAQTGTLSIELGSSTTPGTTYDQIVVNGPNNGVNSTVTLTGSQLDLTTLSSFSPSPGQKFTIIKNNANKPVVGEFSGRADGSYFKLDGAVFRITYKQDEQGTHDVVLDTVEPATIAGKVWLDKDVSGTRQSGEAGKSGVTVKAYDSNNAVAGTATTDVNGNYSIGGLTPGQYTVKFTAPAEYRFSPKDKGGDDTVDSDADYLSGVTSSFSLTSGQNLANVDAGISVPVIVKSVQHVTVTVQYGETSSTAAITPVELSKSWVMGSARQGADWGDNAAVRFELVPDSNGTTASQVKVIRGGDGGNSVDGVVTADVSVTEFLSGVTVKHLSGSSAVSFGSSTTSKDVTLTGLTAPADKAFVIVSGSTTSNSPTQDGLWAFQASLINNGTAVRLKRTETGTAAVASVQVIVFHQDSGATVQTGTATAGGAAAALTPVDGQTPFLAFSASAPQNAGGVEGKYRVSGSISGNTASFTTAAGGSPEVIYYAVFIPGMKVQGSTASFTAETSEGGSTPNPVTGVHKQTVTLSQTVSLSKSFAMVTASGGTANRTDTLGDTSFTAVLSGSSLTLTRADRVNTPNTANASSLESAATAAWFVISLPDENDLWPADPIFV